MRTPCWFCFPHAPHPRHRLHKAHHLLRASFSTQGYGKPNAVFTPLVRRLSAQTVVREVTALYSEHLRFGHCLIGLEASLWKPWTWENESSLLLDLGDVIPGRQGGKGHAVSRTTALSWGSFPWWGVYSKMRLSHPHTDTKPRLAHSDDLIPEHEHALSSSCFFKGRGNVSSLVKIGSGPAGRPAVRTALIASLIFCFERVQGVLAGQKVGNLLWGQRTRSLSCVNRSRSGSDFKAWFPSDDGER